ncbi:MAG TPA: hypothetical protein PLJ29_16925, partial [Leptospiraceae bacterium]|nr:hypothetical protein [Leptospiraceae bacterium]HNO26928.1 hypothetical protein [Leptospiraceae bacterium]
PQFADHSREFQNFRYVYPVISRRSEGISIGINLSPRKECNFDCPYCQVDRTVIEEKERVIDLNVLKLELEEMFEICDSGKLFLNEKFGTTPEHLRRLRDIAVSGDGEPTTSRYFLPVSELLLEFISEKKRKVPDLHPVLITNAARLDHDDVFQMALRYAELGGGPWLKLDAGTEEEFKTASGSRIPFHKIKDNIIRYASVHPAVLQTMIYLNSEGIESFHPERYSDCILEMQKSGARFSHIQLYTLARKTAVQGLSPVSEQRMNEISEIIGSRTGIPLKLYL